MVNIKKAFKNKRLMLALTGLTPDEFNDLLPVFTQEWERAKYDKYLQKIDVRKRKPGGGSKGKLKDVADKLFYILFYYKSYPTFDVLGFIFDCDRGNAKKRKDQFELILEKTLGRKLVLPKRKINSIEEFLQAFPEVKEIFVDGTERPIQRPKDNEKQKKNYSGKKKRHTRKNLIISNKKKRIGFLSKTVEGKKHDFTMFKEEFLPEHIPKDVKSHVDSAFQGFEDEYPDHAVSIPKKKPKNKELPQADIEENKGKSSVRVLIEHAIGGAPDFGHFTQI